MSEFWKVHSKNANLDEMMLDSNAEKLNKFEMNEILTMIPDYSGKNLLELGAGIGFVRFLCDVIIQVFRTRNNSCFTFVGDTLGSFVKKPKML